MLKIAGFIARIIEHPDDEKLGEQVRAEVGEMARQFPVPGIDD